VFGRHRREEQHGKVAEEEAELQARRAVEATETDDSSVDVDEPLEAEEEPHGG
jgi:hypothetical protein